MVWVYLLAICNMLIDRKSQEKGAAAMLTYLSARNFKSWKELKPVQLGKVNLLFGENSSGKTSILQLLLLLRQTVKSYDRAQPLNLGSPDSLVDLGVYEDFIYQHDESHPFAFEFAWKTGESESKQSLDACLQVEFEYEADTIRVNTTAIQVGQTSGSLRRAKRQKNYFLYRDNELAGISSAPVAAQLAPIVTAKLFSPQVDGI